MFARLLAILGLFTAIAGAQPAVAQESITVFAAASLKNALDDTDAAFTKATGVRVVASYAASSALAKQIESGAPADVFISADLKWMDYVADKKLIKPDTRINLLGNRLVLIAPANSKLNVKIEKGFDIAKLAGDGRIAVADVKAVPARPYAKAALDSSAHGQRPDPSSLKPRTSRDARFRGARRDANRHRLRDRRQGRAEGENRGDLSRIAPIRRSLIRWRQQPLPRMAR